MTFIATRALTLAASRRDPARGIRARPSSSPTSGSYPSASRAAETSARLCRTSPGRGGAWSTAASSPETALISRTSPLIVTDVADAMLNAPETPSARAASRFARATSRTLTKSRVCSPSS